MLDLLKAVKDLHSLLHLLGYQSAKYDPGSPLQSHWRPDAEAAMVHWCMGRV